MSEQRKPERAEPPAGADEPSPGPSSHQAPASAPAAEDGLGAVAGALASGVAGELSRPLRQLRENLAVMVEALDHYVGHARGPTPYPWKSLQHLRQELADTYLLSRSLARLASDLSDAVSERGQVPEPVEVNKLVESAVNLARHRIHSQTELFIDLGLVAPVRAVPGKLILAIAQLIVVAADSAAALDGAALSIRTRPGERGGRSEVLITVADNGRGNPAGAAAAERVLGALAEAVGGSYAGTSEPDKGSMFELRLPAR